MAQGRPGGYKHPGPSGSALAVRVVPGAPEWHLLTTGGRSIVKLVGGRTEARKEMTEGLDGAPAMPAAQTNEQTRMCLS